MKALAVIAALACGSVALSAQSPPTVQGTGALEGSVKSFYRAANTVVVATLDGVEHVYHFTKDLVVHGGKGTGADALAGLREGATVVVHYTVNGAPGAAKGPGSGQGAVATEIDRIGDEGLTVAEGTVTRIDRRQKQITIRFDNGKTETLKLTDRAAEEAGPDIGEAAKVVVYYRDEAGQQVAHYFKKAH